MLLFTSPKSQSIAIQPIEERLRLYNQYPGYYKDFDHMRLDLDRIKNMGFKQVWVNPFFEACQTNPITRDKVNCPYAMKDETKINLEFGKDLDQVRAYTQQARNLGLVPLFDFVGRHVAIDHLLVSGQHILSEKYNTQKWFKRHSNGELVIWGMDKNLVATSDDPWSDVAEFNYQDEKVCTEIIEHFWKPFIKFNIVSLGFMGARLDAVGHIPRHVHDALLTYMDKICREHHFCDAYSVAETVGVKYIEKDMVVKGLVTHTMNSSFWMPGPEGRDGHTYALWQDDHNIYATAKHILQTAGYTAGHSGSHDEPRYPFLLKQKGVENKDILELRMLEMIMVSAFSSDGGHILSYGDEYGVESQVDLFKPNANIIEQEKQYDLEQNITEINAVVQQLPKPQMTEWTQRVFIEQYPNLAVFIVHPEDDYRGTPHLIIGNFGPKNTNAPKLTQNMLDQLMQANGRNTTRLQTKHPEKIYLCGDIDFDKSLLSKVVCSKASKIERKIGIKI